MGRLVGTAVLVEVEGQSRQHRLRLDEQVVGEKVVFVTWGSGEEVGCVLGMR